MSTYRHAKRGWLGVVMVSCAVMVTSGRALEASAKAADAAVTVTEQAGISRGLCVVVGCDDASTLVALAERSRFHIHALHDSAAVVGRLQGAIEQAELHGERVVVEKASLDGLPHTENLVDVVVVFAGDAEAPDAELLRALRPRGVALRVAMNQQGPGKLSVVKRIVKPARQGEDAWSHWEHGPDNNPVSTDRIIRYPYMTQWLGEPLYIAMPAITTAAGGRTFIAMGHIAHHRREEPWLNTVLARNGYNGTPLWTLKLPDGYLAHRSAFIAGDETFMLIDLDGEGCLMLDAQTGREKGRLELPDTPGHWKWIAKKGDMLFALIGKKPDPAETTVVRSKLRAWSWGELSLGYYQRRVPWGFGEVLVAFDLRQGKPVWRHVEDKPMDSRAMAIGGGHVYFYVPDAHLGKLDIQTGKVVWLNDNTKLRELVEEPGRGLSSTPGFRSMCYALYTPKALYLEAQTRMNVVAVSLQDGSMLWHRKKTTNNPNLLYADGYLHLGVGKEGSTLQLDPLTGKVVRDLGFRKRSCARLTATPDSLFCRGWPEGLTRYDRQKKVIQFNGAVRPACNDGVIGANGLLYIGPWLCDCNLSIMGRWSLCSAGDFAFQRPVSGDERLEPGEVRPGAVQPMPAGPTGWATYRGGIDRSGMAPVEVPKRVVRSWLARHERPQATPPTAAAGLVFVCDGYGRVTALDASDGRERWRFHTAGRILQPPTIAAGIAYVGSGDGYVYALEAATGRLVWRFRGAPVERRIMLYGAVGSTWPVNTGVMVDQGVAYFAAGVIDVDGTYVYAVDAKTGRPTWCNDETGHLDKDLRKGVSAQGTMTRVGDQLWMNGGNVIPLANYRLSDGTYLGIGPGNGAPRGNRGQEIGLARGHILINGGRLLYSARENVVNPGTFHAMSSRHGSTPLLLCHGRIAPTWDDDRIVFVDNLHGMPMCCRLDDIESWLAKKNDRQRPRTAWVAHCMKGRMTVSLAMTRNAVIAVCESPITRRIRSDWHVFALDPRNGDKLWEHRLSGPALPGGLCIDRDGRILVVLEDGRLECLAKRKAV